MSGDYLVTFGRKYKGKKLKDIPVKEMEGYLKWLEASTVREGTALSLQVMRLKEAFDAYTRIPPFSQGTPPPWPTNLQPFNPIPIQGRVPTTFDLPPNAIQNRENPEMIRKQAPIGESLNIRKPPNLAPVSVTQFNELNERLDEIEKSLTQIMEMLIDAKERL